MKIKVLALTILSTFILSACGGAAAASEEVVAFAECLTENNVVMYGAYWCPHCKDQKDLFGSAFDKITYVECDKNGENAEPETCLEKKISGYPTWVYDDGDRVSGEQSFEELAKLSGGKCEAPSTEE